MNQTLEPGSLPFGLSADIHSDVLAVYKPQGIQCHRSNPEDWGLLEWLEDRFQTPLFLFQRLDLGTSGILLIARNELAAQKWTEKLKAKRLQKTYYFISKTNAPNGSLDGKSQVVHSKIEKVKGVWTSQMKPNFVDANAETQLTLIKKEGPYTLFKAEPRTGKAHQIRLHAQHLGYPILGDNDHGGAPFPRLCLHATELTDLEDGRQWSVSPPPYFTELGLFNDPRLCALLDASETRLQLQKFGMLSGNTFRWSHQESEACRIDQFSDQIWVYDYQNAGTMDLISSWLTRLPEGMKKPVFIREMKNRGRDPNAATLAELHQPKSVWVATENAVQFEMRSDQGLSPGLFLDQRENRNWVLQNSKNKRVLNLFSYTCGFSVCAALGGASEVVSIDVSRNFLEWGKQNFKLNDLDPNQFEFRIADSKDYVSRAQKHHRRFDLIICDPPSFGRSPKGIFRIEKDLSALVKDLVLCLTPGGIILLSTNYEKWDLMEFKKAALQNLESSPIQILPAPKPGLDFLEHRKALLKTLLIRADC